MRRRKRIAWIVLATSVIVLASLVLSIKMGTYVDTVEAVLSFLRWEEEPFTVGFFGAIFTIIFGVIGTILSSSALIALYSISAEIQSHERRAR